MPDRLIINLYLDPRIPCVVVKIEGSAQVFVVQEERIAYQLVDIFRVRADPRPEKIMVFMWIFRVGLRSIPLPVLDLTTSFL